MPNNDDDGDDDDVHCREFPSVIELVSYVFCFHGMMCGPFCFYKDYVAFIDGSNYTSVQSAATTATRNGGVWSDCRNGAGRAMSSSSRRQSLRSDDVSVSDGRSGTNSHRRRPAGLAPPPPAPGVP